MQLSRVPTPAPESYKDSVGVVDIGSNSIRLVIFDALSRTPLPLFNERIFCGLGKGLAETGRLSDESMDRALRTIVRFARLTEELGVRTVDFVATAALRDAENGPAFVEKIVSSCGANIRILGGPEEARLSALGVIGGHPKADGIVGDLGGGSLELVEIQEGRITEQTTLPVGVLRFDDAYAADPKAVRARVREIAETVPWLGRRDRKELYPVGGAWRSFARLHMEQQRHPVHVIHAYTIPGQQALDFADLVGGMRPQSLSGVRTINRKRIDTLPLAAAMLGELIRLARPRRIRFSASGLREGVLFDRLSSAEMAEDPLLRTAEQWALRDARFPDMSNAIYRWLAPLYKNRRSRRQRLRRAACYLSDIAWREHPDYRAEQAFLRILRYPMLGLDHSERVFLAYAIYVRYGGDGGEPEMQRYLPLLSQRALKRAEVIGRGIRLAYRVSGGSVALLRRTSLELDGDEIVLHLPQDGSLPLGDAVEREFNALVRAIGMKNKRIEG